MVSISTMVSTHLITSYQIHPPLLCNFRLLTLSDHASTRVPNTLWFKEYQTETIDTNVDHKPSRELFYLFAIFARTQKYTTTQPHIQRNIKATFVLTVASGLPAAWKKGINEIFPLLPLFSPSISFPEEQQKGGTNVGVDGACNGHAIGSPVREKTQQCLTKLD